MKRITTKDVSATILSVSDGSELSPHNVKIDIVDTVNDIKVRRTIICSSLEVIEKNIARFLRQYIDTNNADVDRVEKRAQLIGRVITL